MTTTVLASQHTAPNLTVDAANGTTYAYRRYGKPGTVPVVFFQHFRGNLDNWDPALVDDIAAEREVVLFDASGVGLSTGAVPTSFAGFGRDALAFVDALGLTEADLFGFSIGGFVAQEVALQRPHLVRRMVLAGTGPRGGRDMHGWPAGPRAHAMKDVQGAEDILYLFFGPSAASQAKGMEFVGRIFTRTEARDTTPDLAVRDAQAAAIIDWGVRDTAALARLESIHAPTLVANGDHDIMVPTVNSYLLAGHLPDARLTIYPDANHGFLFQYPHEFAAEVTAFLSAPTDSGGR
jgi:pimeloyl-ACP methyl ester carboxylesterase